MDQPNDGRYHMTDYTEPVTLRNLSGTVPPIRVICRRTAKQQFAVQVIGCAPGTVFESITVVGAVDPADVQDWMDNVPDGIADLSGCVFQRIELHRVNTGFAQRASGSVVEYIEAHEISGDMGITLTDDCSVLGGQLVSSLEIFPYSHQHRDVWQVAKKGGVIRNVHIDGLVSDGSDHPHGNRDTLQGILFTDCFADGCSVTGCTIIGGHPVHGITLGAATGCRVTGNRTDAQITVGWGNALAYDNDITGNSPEAISMIYDAEKELGLGGDLPRGIRNNNPGNVEHSPSNNWLGMADPASDGRYCIFNDPRNGIRAFVLLLLNYQRVHRLKTITAILERYAPRQDKNATDAYIRFVSEQVGVSPKAAITLLGDYRITERLVKAIIQFENGMQPYPDELIQEGIGRAMPVGNESGVGAVKPATQSTEQVAAGTAAASAGGMAGLEWLKGQVEQNQTQVIDGITKIQQSMDGVHVLGWAQVALLVAILGSIWYLAWRRGEASFLGIR